MLSFKVKWTLQKLLQEHHGRVNLVWFWFLQSSARCLEEPSQGHLEIFVIQQLCEQLYALSYQDVQVKDQMLSESLLYACLLHLLSLRYRDPCFYPCFHLQAHSWMCGASLHPMGGKTQRAQNAFVLHRGCAQPLLRSSGCLLVKPLWWKSSQKQGKAKLWPLNSPTAVSIIHTVFELQEALCLPKTYSIFGTAAGIVKLHAAPSRGRCYVSYWNRRKGLRNDQQFINLTFHKVSVVSISLPQIQHAESICCFSCIRRKGSGW